MMAAKGMTKIKIVKLLLLVMMSNSNSSNGKEEKSKRGYDTDDELQHKNGNNI